MKIFLLQLDLKKKIGLCYVRAFQPVGTTQGALKKMQGQKSTFRSAETNLWGQAWESLFYEILGLISCDKHHVWSKAIFPSALFSEYEWLGEWFLS